MNFLQLLAYHTQGHPKQTYTRITLLDLLSKHAWILYIFKNSPVFINMFHICVAYLAPYGTTEGECLFALCCGEDSTLSFLSTTSIQFP